MKSYHLFALLLFAVVLGACGGSSSNGGASAAASVVGLDPAAFQKAISWPGAYVLNVHVPYENEIEGTTAFIAYDRLRESASQLPKDKAAPLYVYCRSGNMSAQAVETLKKMGYTRLFELTGGMAAWREAGLPLVSKPGRS